MKEYVVLKINCPVNLKLSDIFAYLNKKVVSHRNYFALQELKFQNFDERRQKTFNEMGLANFSYEVVLPHLKTLKYYEPAKYSRQMISNLDNCWEWNNESCHQSLDKNQFEKLITFCDGLSTTSFSTMLLGVDEIEWNGTTVTKGTYGYQRANCTYLFGENYLSNSVTVGRDYSSKTYTVCLSCEKRYRTLPIISETIEFLGKIKAEYLFFAPETKTEREEWERTAKKAKLTFYNALHQLKNLPLLSIEKCTDIDETEKINIKKYITKYLCTDGWALQKALPDEWPTVVCKAKRDTMIKFSVVSGHNGHHIQVLCYYRCAKFKFCEHIYELTFNEISEKNIERLFLNAVLIRNFLYETL